MLVTEGRWVGGVLTECSVDTYVLSKSRRMWRLGQTQSLFLPRILEAWEVGAEGALKAGMQDRWGRNGKSGGKLV